MSFRLQRSIKIAKGIRLNVSKSGLGVSVGPRGAKLSVGPRGVYGSAGIPGTGLSTRQKFYGTSTQNKNGQANSGAERSIRVEIKIDEENGNEIVTLFENDVKINDESILRKIKKDPSFKDKLEEVREKAYSEVIEKTNVFLDIFKHSEDMTDWNIVSEEIKNTKPVKYIKKEFNIQKPSKESVEEKLYDEAKNKIKGLFGKKKKKQAYVKENLEAVFSECLTSWNNEKKQFEENENNTEKEENKKNQNDYDNWLKEMKRLMNPDKKFIEERLEDLFSDIQLPADFSISFEVRSDGKDILLDIDLPEIEDFPNKKAQKLSSGKISIKDKTQKELKEDYFTSIAGMSVYFASIAFTAAPIIEKVFVSGYTQRVNKATGNTEDEYIYSVIYDKEGFSKLKMGSIDPKMTLQSFENRIEVTKTFDLKTIQPIA